MAVPTGWTVTRLMCVVFILLSLLSLSTCTPTPSSPSFLNAHHLDEFGESVYPNRVLNRIAFGSCNKEHLPQPLWEQIEKHVPELFLWLGDIVYADQQVNSFEVLLSVFRPQLFLFLFFPSCSYSSTLFLFFFSPSSFFSMSDPISPAAEIFFFLFQQSLMHRILSFFFFLLLSLFQILPSYFLPSSPSRQQRKFKQQFNREEYQKFLKTGISVWGIYDDHDYGMNDGGETYPYKRHAQETILRFLQEPEDSPRWKREGIFGGRNLWSRDWMDAIYAFRSIS